MFDAGKVPDGPEGSFVEVAQAAMAGVARLSQAKRERPRWLRRRVRPGDVFRFVWALVAHREGVRGESLAGLLALLTRIEASARLAVDDEDHPTLVAPLGSTPLAAHAPPRPLTVPCRGPVGEALAA